MIPEVRHARGRIEPSSSEGALDVTEVRAKVHRRLADEYDPAAFEGPDGADALRDTLARLVRDESPLLSRELLDVVVGDLVHEVIGLGPIEPLLADPEVTEIMINGPGRAWVERAGWLETVDLGLDSRAIARLVERAVAPLGLRCDRTSPIVDARLADGSRFHAVVPPLAVDGPYVTIRRFGTREVPLRAFTDDAVLLGFLGWAVVAGWNLLVSGGTSSGKTTLLNALSALVPGRERMVTIEETAELRLRQPHVVRLEARRANAEGVGAVSVRDLVRAALRMRPERIVVGEVRGPEALDMVEALNTGHDGSLSTIHANGTDEALLRLETLALRSSSRLPAASVRAHIASSIDAVIHVARRTDGHRRIVAVGEVTGGPSELGIRPLFDATGAVGRPGRRARRYDAPGPPC